MASGIPFGWYLADSSGIPLAAAKIAFKIKGTSTNATTYTNSALTVPATNPVIADGSGYFLTYLDPGVNYDITVKSSDESVTYLSFSESPSATGSQPVDATLTALAGAGFENRKFPRGSGPDTVQNVTLSTASGIYYVEDYGAAGNNSTDDRVAIQAAIDAAETAGGGTVWITRGKKYLVSSSGNSLGGRTYAIALKPGVIIDGGGTIARFGTTMSFTLIAGFGTGTFPSVTQTMGIQNITVDGRASTRVDGGASTPANGDGFSVWLFNLLNPVCQNVKSIDAASWGFRIERCLGGSFINRVSARHGEDVNADGIHFVDCRDLSGHGFEIETQGDDAFIIEANSYDTFNLNFTGIMAQAINSPFGPGVGSRSIVLLRDTSLSTTTRNFYNIRIDGVSNGGNQAGLEIAAHAANVYGCDINIVSYGDYDGAKLSAGNTDATGKIYNNKICVLAVDSVRNGVLAFTQNSGVIENNQIDWHVRNPGDGFNGIEMSGARYQGSIFMDYDPAGTKATPESGILLSTVTNSQLMITARGGDDVLDLSANADSNTILLGTISGGVTRAIRVQSGAENNRFIGGNVTGTVLNSGGSTNEFIGVQGLSASIAAPDPISWTPTVTASSGSITTSSITFARYRIINRTVFFSVAVAVTDNGTGSGTFQITAPTGTAQFGSQFTARNSASGVALIATIGTTASSINVLTAAGAYPVASGQTIFVTGFYFLT